MCVYVVWVYREGWKGEVFHGITYMNNTRWPKLAAWLGPASRAVCVWAGPSGRRHRARRQSAWVSYREQRKVDAGSYPQGRRGANGEPQMCKRYSYFSVWLLHFVFSFFLFLATKLQIFSSGNFKFSSERVKLKCSLDLCKYLHCIDRHNLRFTVQVFCPCLPFPLHPYQHLWR